MLGYISIKNLTITKISYKDSNDKQIKYFFIGRYKKSTLPSGEDKITDVFTEIDYKINKKLIYMPLETVLDNYDVFKCGYIKKSFLFELLCDLNKDLTEGRDITSKKSKTSSQKNNHMYTHLTDKKFEVEPAIGRKQEIDNIITILASKKKNPILVGESGTGKSAIVDELAYLIQKGDVPRFLQDQEIVAISSSDLVAGSRWVGSIEKKFNNLIDYVKSCDAILFIDEMHTAFGAGASANDDNDLAELLKKAINIDDLKVIGATTRDEYDKYFSVDALKRRFEIVSVKEPNDKNLEIIARKVFEDYSDTIGISLEKIEDNIMKIIEILIEATKKEHRKYDDMAYNPDLVITIIDTAFAKSRIDDKPSIDINDIIYGVRSNNRLYDLHKDKCISKLEGLIKKEKQFEKKKQSNQVINFNKK